MALFTWRAPSLFPPFRVAGAVALVLAVVSPASAQRRWTPARPAWHAQLGAVVLASPYVKDANGTDVKSRVGPAALVGASWTSGSHELVSLDLRLARTGVVVRDDGGERGVGAATQGDLVASLGYQPAARLTLHAGVGVSHLTGDDAVTPFRDGNRRPWHLGGEIGALVRLGVDRPLSLHLTLHGLRLGSASVGDPTSVGSLTRLLAGVQYGR